MYSNPNEKFLFCLNVLPSVCNYFLPKCNADSKCYATCSAWLSPYVARLTNHAAIQFALQLHCKKQRKKYSYFSWHNSESDLFHFVFSCLFFICVLCFQQCTCFLCFLFFALCWMIAEYFFCSQSNWFLLDTFSVFIS